MVGSCVSDVEGEMGLTIKTVSVLFVFFFLCVPSFAQTNTGREDAIARRLMCPTCAGQTVAESSSALARDMRREIKKRVREGKSDEEIVRYFKENYGDGILAEPSFGGFNLLVWLLPLIAALTGAVFAADYIRRNMRG